MLDVSKFQLGVRSRSRVASSADRLQAVLH